MRKPISTALLCGVFSLGAISSLTAQCGEADFGPVLGTGDDVVFAGQPLGFAFPFAGGTYTDVHISTNGLMYLSNAGTPAPGGSGCCNGDPAALVAGSPTIAPFWTDLNVVVGTGTVHFNSSIPGKAVITWKNVYEFGGTVQRTIQCQLTAGGEIYFSYDDRVALATHTALVGCSEGGGAVLPAAVDFSTGVSTTTDTNYELFDGTVNLFDLASDTLLMVPTLPGWAWAASYCPAGTNVHYGSGCYSNTGDDSAYSLITDAAVWGPQLQGTALTFVPSGSTYVMVSAGAFVAPTAAATPLVLTDDSIATTPALTNSFPYPGGLATSFAVCSNGHVAVATGNAVAYNPAVATFLNNPASAWYSWTDYNPTAAGQVLFEEVGTNVYVTWDAVQHYGAVGAVDTFQFQFDTVSGAVTIAWDSMSLVNPTLSTTMLVGYSPGGPSNDLGSIDLTTALPFPIPAATFPLAIEADQPLINGSTTTLTVANVPELVPASGVHVSLLIISPVQIAAPGLDLTFLGMPGCVLLANLDLTLSAVGLSPVAQYSIPIGAAVPPGTTLYMQAASLFQPFSLPNGQNAFGGITSDGIAMSSGSW